MQFLVLIAGSFCKIFLLKFRLYEFSSLLLLVQFYLFYFILYANVELWLDLFFEFRGRFDKIRNQVTYCAKVSLQLMRVLIYG